MTERSTQREPQSRYAAGALLPILQRQAAAMGLRNLAAQRQPDARASGFGREEWNEQIRGVGKAWTFILDPNLVVRSVEPNDRTRTQMAPNDPKYGDAYWARSINLEPAWDTTVGLPSAVIAVFGL